MKIYPFEDDKLFSSTEGQIDAPPIWANQWRKFSCCSAGLWDMDVFLSQILRRIEVSGPINYNNYFERGCPIRSIKINNLK
jgi:hypothetical protein